MSNTLGFIGGGNMSTAIFKGILKSGQFPAARIWVSGPHLENLTEWRKLGANITTKNGDVLNLCDVIFLGVKPHMLPSALKACLETLPNDYSWGRRKEVLFISMLAGVTTAQLHEVLQDLTEKARIIRIMPNTPMTVGEGSCLITPAESATAFDCRMLETLLSGSCVHTQVPESMMDSLGALVGCGPAYMYIVIEALSDGAVKQGVPRDLAQKFAAQMMLGSAKMVLEANKHPGLLKDEVCSPGGSTICGVTALENGSIRASIINAIEASTRRNRELGAVSRKSCK